MYRRNTWCFTVADYVIVEDFEEYFDTPDWRVDYSGASLTLESSVAHEGTPSMKFSLAGVDLKRIVNLAILMGDPIAHQQGGSGKLFIDDIRLTDLAP